MTSGEEFEIKHRYTNDILHTVNADTLLGANLSGANLHGADLHGADLRGANLSGANLHGADLHGADLRDAKLHGANLLVADLHGANLRGADLHGADLHGANLLVADLRGANLRGADLHGERLIKTPVSILNLIWDILITDNYLMIGCKRFTHAEWANFTDDEIKDMEPRASKFWTTNKSWLLSACKAHCKESLEYRKSNPIKETK